MKLNDNELEALLNDLESDRAERKETFGGDAPEKVRQAICAFANDLPNHAAPGVVFIGARDDAVGQRRPHRRPWLQPSPSCRDPDIEASSPMRIVLF